MTLEAPAARGKREQAPASPDHDKSLVRTKTVFAICHFSPQCSQLTLPYEVVCRV